MLVFLFFILEAVYLLSEYFIADHSFGVPLDDVWIHFRFAENFAAGHFLEYNIGHPTPGTTSPLWVILLSLPFVFSGKLILPYALFLSSAFLLLTVMQTYKLSLKTGLDKNYAMIVSVLTLFCGRMLWSSLSGMEITLFCFLSVSILLVHLDELQTGKLSIPNGILLGLAANLRPETYLLASLYFTVTFFIIAGKDKSQILKFILSLSVFIILILPYPLFSFAVAGSFLPTTFRGQGGDFKFYPDIKYLFEMGKYFIKDNPIILFIWVLSLIYFVKSSFKKNTDIKLLLINLWLLMLPMVSSFIIPNWRHHGRYLIPLIPFINIVCLHILKNNSEKMTVTGRKIVFSILIFFSLPGTVIFASSIGWNVQNINAQQVKIAEWLNKNHPGESCFGTNDIGAITFITKRKVVDMVALVTPEVLEFWKMDDENATKSLLKLLRKEQVNYIIAYPTWFEYMMAHYGDKLQPVYSEKLVKNTICGGPEMFVYKIIWEKMDLD